LAERLADWHSPIVRGYKTADAFIKAVFDLGETDDIELFEEEVIAMITARWASTQGK
jgi:hypothetical protein